MSLAAVACPDRQAPNRRAPVRLATVRSQPDGWCARGGRATVISCTGRLVVPIQRSYTMAQVPQAFADFAARTLGKLAVQIDA